MESSCSTYTLWILKTKEMVQTLKGLGVAWPLVHEVSGKVLKQVPDQPQLHHLGTCGK